MVQKARPERGGGPMTATNLDGAYFGSSLPQVFIANHENLMEQAGTSMRWWSSILSPLSTTRDSTAFEINTDHINKDVDTVNQISTNNHQLDETRVNIVDGNTGW